MIDDRTVNLDLPLPNIANLMRSEDIPRIRAALTAIDTAVATKATPADITAAVNALLDGAPGALNTLNELAAALADDASIEFGYEYDPFGKLGEPVVHALDAEAFLHTSKALDLALVAVRPRDVTGLRDLRAQRLALLGHLVLLRTQQRDLPDQRLAPRDKQRLLLGHLLGHAFIGSRRGRHLGRPTDRR